MHGRYGVGDPPADVLRRLPDDAASRQVWFHRPIGPSGLRAITLCTVAGVFGTVSVVAAIRSGR